MATQKADWKTFSVPVVGVPTDHRASATQVSDYQLIMNKFILASC